MYLDQLAYFIEVVKCGSISAAAKNLYISQPALSQSIANLENELGMKLVKRSHSGIKPTMFGESIFARAQGIISQLDDALASWKCLAAESLELSGTVKISCTPDTTDFLNSAVSEEMQHAYPNISLYVTPMPGMYFSVEDFSKSGVSIGIGASLEGLEDTVKKDAEDAGFCFQTFSRRPPILLLNKKNPLAEQEFITPEDMKQLKVCVYPEEPAAPFTRFFSGISCQMATEDALASYISSNPGSAILVILADMKKQLTTKFRNLTYVPIKADPNIFEFETICHFLIHKNENMLTAAEKCTLDVLKYRLNDF